MDFSTLCDRLTESSGFQFRTMEEFKEILEIYREEFHKQVDQLQELMITECRQTGTNPFKEQMVVDFMFDVRSYPIEATPLKTVRPFENVDDAGPSVGPVKRGRGRLKGSKNLTTSAAKKLKSQERESRLVESCPNFTSGISEAERETGNQEIADSVLMRFDAVRRHFCQLGNVKKPLTTAVSNCKNLGVTTNMRKRIGPVPGVQVGDILFEWGEMNLVGLHRPTVSGIEWLKIEDGDMEYMLATSIVTSGHPGDVTTEEESLIYTGQGGADKDQVLEKGNLALRGSYIFGKDVRVIRGQQDPNDENQKIYIYDGLYKVLDFWKEKTNLGFQEFKIRLVRKPDQQPGYEVWKDVKTWRMYGFDVLRKGFAFLDFSCGKETQRVSVLNEVDDNNRTLPEHFEYITSQYNSLSPLDYKTNTLQSFGCQDQTCGSDCICLQRNDGKLPYHNSILVCRKPMVYECGEFCSCSLDCKMRVLQRGLKIHVEVFKTEKCGWGLRSSDPIRRGTFICEFAGVRKTKQEVEEEEDNDYLFDSARFYNPFRWNHEPQLAAEDYSEQVSEAFNLSSRVLISAKEYGNVGRFMNHSCSPNVFWQPIEYRKNNATYVSIGMFAMKHIPPLKELTYDYGMSCEEVGDDGNKVYRGKKICLCGSEKCRNSFG